LSFTWMFLSYKSYWTIRESDLINCVIRALWRMFYLFFIIGKLRSKARYLIVPRVWIWNWIACVRSNEPCAVKAGPCTVSEIVIGTHVAHTSSSTSQIHMPVIFTVWPETLYRIWNSTAMCVGVGAGSVLSLIDVAVRQMTSVQARLHW
jgi:hypothetical protein